MINIDPSRDDATTPNDAAGSVRTFLVLLAALAAPLYLLGHRGLEPFVSVDLAASALMFLCPGRSCAADGMTRPRLGGHQDLARQDDAVASNGERPMDGAASATMSVLLVAAWLLVLATLTRCGYQSRCPWRSSSASSSPQASSSRWDGRGSLTRAHPGSVCTADKLPVPSVRLGGRSPRPLGANGHEAIDVVGPVFTVGLRVIQTWFVERIGFVGRADRDNRPGFIERHLGCARRHAVRLRSPARRRRRRSAINRTAPRLAVGRREARGGQS